MTAKNETEATYLTILFVSAFASSIAWEGKKEVIIEFTNDEFVNAFKQLAITN